MRTTACLYSEKGDCHQIRVPCGDPLDLCQSCHWNPVSLNSGHRFLGFQQEGHTGVIPLQATLRLTRRKPHVEHQLRTEGLCVLPRGAHFELGIWNSCPRRKEASRDTADQDPNSPLHVSDPMLGSQHLLDAQLVCLCTLSIGDGVYSRYIPLTASEAIGPNVVVMPKIGVLVLSTMISTESDDSDMLASVEHLEIEGLAVLFVNPCKYAKRAFP